MSTFIMQALSSKKKLTNKSFFCVWAALFTFYCPRNLSSFAKFSVAVSVLRKNMWKTFN